MMVDCYLSRMDIVGYSNHYIDDPNYVNDMLNKIVYNLKIMLLNFNNSANTQYGLVFHQMYGDTLDIYFKSEDSDDLFILALIDISCKIQMELLKAGFIVRGAIVYGDLIDTDLIFTGQAMVESSNLEKEIDSPFIAISEKVYSELFNNESIHMFLPNSLDYSNYFSKLIYTDTDSSLKKLDYYNHTYLVIDPEQTYTIEVLNEAISKSIEMSKKNSNNGPKSKLSSEKMVKELNRYSDYCKLKNSIHPTLENTSKELNTQSQHNGS